MAGFLHMLAFRPLASSGRTRDDGQRDLKTRAIVDSRSADSRRPIHRAWLVAAVTFVTMLGAAGVPVGPERADGSAAQGVRLVARHHRLGDVDQHDAVRADVAVRRGADGPVRHPARWSASRWCWSAAGSGLTVFMTSAWQLLLCWGLLVGLGTGSMSMAFVATVSNRWFVARRGLVSGMLTAGERDRPAGLPAADRRAGRRTTAGGRPR